MRDEFKSPPHSFENCTKNSANFNGLSFTMTQLNVRLVWFLNFLGQTMCSIYDTTILI